MKNSRRNTFIALVFGLAVSVSSLVSAQQSPSAQTGPSPNPSAVLGAKTTVAVIPPLPLGIAAQAHVTGVPSKPGAGMSPDDFAALLNRTLPLNEAQIREVNKLGDVTKRAKVARVGPAPRPVSVSARVTLDAGANPHVLRLSSDMVTSVVFTDVTGAPWNVVKVVAGMIGALDISKTEGGPPTHMFTILPKDDYVSTNLAIFLEGAPAPIMMAVEMNQANVDYRVDVSVQARGPSAVTPVISRGLTDSVSAELISMVAGVTPNQARPLKIISSDVPDVQAWVLGTRMFVRTKANILTPAVPKDGKVATGADGTKVYELPVTPEVRLMSGGSIGRLQLGGFPAPTFLAAITK